MWAYTGPALVEWLFAFPQRLSVTISNGDRLVDMGGTRIDTLYDMTFALQDHKPGDTLDLVEINENFADLLRSLQTLAVQSNLTIRVFKPAPVVTKELHAEWPINIELDGTYHNLGLFFDRISRFSRIINIGNIVLKAKDRPDQGAHQLVSRHDAGARLQRDAVQQRSVDVHADAEGEDAALVRIGFGRDIADGFLGSLAHGWQAVGEKKNDRNATGSRPLAERLD